MSDPENMRDLRVLGRIDDKARQETPHVFEQYRAFAARNPFRLRLWLLLRAILTGLAFIADRA